ncbi:PKD domain-containing protein [Cyclobacterium plantarum]|uniref:PKD domain-containing protein n=1 Tax=Cyclobacterium plantarum TaxID=2716263 RepID=UPI003F6F4CFE
MVAVQEFHQNYFRQIGLGALLLLMFVAIPVQAQLVKPFLPRVPDNGPSTNIYNINGDFAIIGNTNLTLENYSLNFQNNYPMIYVDADDDPQTLNSSSASLVFPDENGADPACTQVVYAGLYWTGRSAEDMQFEVTKSGTTKNYDKKSVSFKVPGQSAYTTVRAQNDQIWFPESYLDQDGLFMGYADVTDLVKAAGQGEYWLADIALQEGTGGSIGYFGGWGLVVIYENPLMEARDVVVFDGYAYVASYLEDDYFLNLDGFSAVEMGDVKVKMGMMAAEGERGGTGDYIEIEKGEGSGEFVRLAHESNDTFNFFNSSIFTEGNPRNPELINNTGIDLSVFELPNENNSIIANGQTKTRIKYTTVIDTYVIFNITFSINARQTRLEAINELVSASGLANDVHQVGANEDLMFRLEIRNKGQEPIEEAKVEIPIPLLAEFSAVATTWLAGGTPANAYYDASKGAGGALIWEIGDIPVSSDPDELLGYLEYTLVSPDNCAGPAGFQCEAEFSLEGEVTGKNAETGIPFSSPLIQGFPSDEECPSNPNSAPLLFEVLTNGESCSTDDTVLEINLCNIPGDGIPVSEIAGNFPDGVRFYDSFPPDPAAMEYNLSNPFPKTNESREFVAILEGDGKCFRPFTISHQSMEALPAVTSAYGGSPISCSGASDGSVFAFVEGGISPYTYQWDDPGNSTTPSLENLPAGTYTVTITDSQSCTATASVTLQQPQPLAIQVDDQNSVLILDCEAADGGIVNFEVSGGSVPVKAELILIEEGGLEETIDRFDFQINRNFSFEALEAGDYVIRATDTNECTQETSFEIQGSQPLSYTTSISPIQNCLEPESAAISIIPDGDSANYTYLWSNGASTASIQDLGPGTYSVVISDSFGCSREEEFSIAPLSPPVFSVSSATEVICGEPGLSTTFFVELPADAAAASIVWSGGQVSGDGRQMVSAQPGNYTVTLTDENGCASEQEVQVLPYALDAGFDIFGPDPGSGPDYFIADEIRFETQPLGNISTYFWDFGDGSMSNEANPIHVFGRKGIYQVSLQVTDANGCTAEETREIVIQEFQIRMPDAFTPAAADGSNAHYFPVFAKIDGLEFWVFNKWGEVIYYTNDKDTPGWDGAVQGREAPAGSYVYKLHYTAPDGSQEQLSGTFILIR